MVQCCAGHPGSRKRLNFLKNQKPFYRHYWTGDRSPYPKGTKDSEELAKGSTAEIKMRTQSFLKIKFQGM